ncbi:MAG: hypothetical protein AB7I30_15275, partial [Isosphaeraceae bacterium]
LHRTPAEPLSNGWKATLWGLALLVGLLLVASLLKGRTSRTSAEKPPSADAPAEESPKPN